MPIFTYWVWMGGRVDVYGSTASTNLTHISI